MGKRLCRFGSGEKKLPFKKQQVKRFQMVSRKEVKTVVSLVTGTRGAQVTGAVRPVTTSFMSHSRLTQTRSIKRFIAIRNIISQARERDGHVVCIYKLTCKRERLCVCVCAPVCLFALLLLVPTVLCCKKTTLFGVSSVEEIY